MALQSQVLLGTMMIVMMMMSGGVQLPRPACSEVFSSWKCEFGSRDRAVGDVKADYVVIFYRGEMFRSIKGVLANGPEWTRGGSRDLI